MTVSDDEGRYEGRTDAKAKFADQQQVLALPMKDKQLYLAKVLKRPSLLAQHFALSHFPRWHLVPCTITIRPYLQGLAIR
jgi:hypothetical protein